MGSLTRCLTEAGKNISREDRNAVLALAKQYREDGLQPQDAAVRAVEDRLRELSGLIGEAYDAPAPAEAGPPAPEPPRVFKTRQGALNAKTGNTQRVQKVKGGYILRQATDAEMAAAEKAGKRLANQGGPDVTKDSLLTAIAKLGGIAMAERADIIGTGNRNIGGKMLFTAGGMPVDELAAGALREFGYVPASEVERDGGGTWLRDAVRAEFNGLREHFSEQGLDDIMQAQREREEAEYGEELVDLDMDDLRSSGYIAASPEVQAATERMLAEAEALGIDTEALREDIAKATEGQTDDEYHAALHQALHRAISEAQAGFGGADAGAARPGGEDRGQAAGGQGQEAQAVAPAGDLFADELAQARADIEGAEQRLRDARAARLRKIQDQILADDAPWRDSPFADRIRTMLRSLLDVGEAGRGMAGAIAAGVRMDAQTGKLTEETVAFRETVARRELARIAQGDQRPALEWKAVTAQDIRDAEPDAASLPEPIFEAAANRLNQMGPDLARKGYADVNEVNSGSPADARELAQRMRDVVTSVVMLGRFRARAEKGAKNFNPANLERAEDFATEQLGISTRDFGAPLLAAQTEADLKAKAEREAAAAKADADEQKRLADKAKADAQRDEFVLTGSDRPADVAAAFGQGGLFDGPAETPEPPPVKDGWDSNPAARVYNLMKGGELQVQIRHAGHPTALRPYYFTGGSVIDRVHPEIATRKFHDLATAKQWAQEIAAGRMPKDENVSALFPTIDQLRDDLRAIEAEILAKAPKKFQAGGGDIEAAALHPQVPKGLVVVRGAIKQRIREMSGAEKPAQPAPRPEADGPVIIPADPDAFGAALRAQVTGESERLAAMFRPDITPVSLPRVTGAGKTPTGVEYLSPDEAAKVVDGWKKAAADQSRAFTSDNANRTVISLFDASGVMAQPWAEAGYNVVAYDLQTGVDINSFNAENLLEQHGNDNVWAILSQPPCTDFAASGAQWWKDKDEDGRTEASNELVRQVLRTVELFRPAVWMLENPVGRIATQNKLPDPLLSFDPWHYGDPYTKRTLLWGRFDPNLPTAMVEPVEGSKIHRMSSGAKYERSLTPEGFAYSFFMANNAAAMDPADRLAAEFAGVSRSLFAEALEAGHTEFIIRSSIDDAYYENDLETVRQELELLAEKPVADAPAQRDWERERDEQAQAIQAKLDAGEYITDYTDEYVQWSHSREPLQRWQVPAEDWPHIEVWNWHDRNIDYLRGAAANSVDRAEQAYAKADKLNKSLRKRDLQQARERESSLKAALAWAEAGGAQRYPVPKALRDAKRMAPIDFHMHEAGRAGLLRRFLVPTERGTVQVDLDFSSWLYAQQDDDSRYSSFGDSLHGLSVSETGYRSLASAANLQFDAAAADPYAYAQKLVAQYQAAHAERTAPKAKKAAAPKKKKRETPAQKKRRELQEAASKSGKPPPPNEPIDDFLSGLPVEKLNALAAKLGARIHAKQRSLTEVAIEKAEPDVDRLRALIGELPLDGGGKVDPVVNGRERSPELRPDECLLLMPCGGEKLDRRARADELYTGPVWQTLRQHRVEGAEPRMAILSAKHGLVAPDLELDPYDERMTPERAAELTAGARDLARGLASGILRGGQNGVIRDVQIVGGAEYRQVWRAVVAELQANGVVAKDASIRETTGAIGVQRKQLGQYLEGFHIPPRGQVPPAVASRVKIALQILRDAEASLANVEKARGRGHILAGEWKDQQEKTKDARTTIAAFRRMAPGNGVDAEAYIQSLGGMPDLDRFNVTPVTAPPAPPTRTNLGAKVTPQMPTAQQIQSFIGIAADSIEKLREVDVDRVITQAPAPFRVALALHIKERRSDLAAAVDEVLAEVRAQQGASKPPAPAPTDAYKADLYDRARAIGMVPGADLANGVFWTTGKPEPGKGATTVTVRFIRQDGKTGAVVSTSFTHIDSRSGRPAVTAPEQRDVVLGTVDEVIAEAQRRIERIQAQQPPAVAPPVTPNKVFTEDAAAAARERLRKKLGRLQSGIDPETMMDGIILAGYHIEKGARTFVAYARAMLADLGEGVRPYLKSWYMAAKYDPRFTAFAADMDSAAVVDAAELPEASDVPAPDADLERDSPDAAPGDAVVGPPVPADGSADGAAAAGSSPAAGGGRQPDAGGVSQGGAAAPREPRDQRVPRGDGQDQPTLFGPGSDDGERGGDAGVPGTGAETLSADEVEGAAAKPLGAAERLKAQRAAEAIPVTPGDLDNIRQTLPYLLPAQQEDVHKAEQRFGQPDGYGMLFTNGTGTGKTFTGLGIVKRFERQGRTNTLVIVPDEKIMSDWVESAKSLGLTVTPLRDTKDGGSGITITTYANAGDNNELVRRNWDLIVPDESHSLMQSAESGATKALKTVRAISLHPRGWIDRHGMLYADDLATMEQLAATLKANIKILNNDDTMDQVADSLRRENAKLEARLAELTAKMERTREEVHADVMARQGEARTRVLMLSATPFAYEQNVDYAEGYLFDYAKDDGNRSQAYNAPTPSQEFMIQHFGWRMRYGKLTEPDAKVDRGVMQRQFNGWLKKRGVLSGRVLDVQADYDRRFVLAESRVGSEIDRALDWIEEQRRAASEANKGNPDFVNGFSDLSEKMYDEFYGPLGYLTRRYLLEAIKAREVIQHVREHMALGRKIVVFHDFKKGGSHNPFMFFPTPVTEDMEPKAKARAEAYNAAVAAFDAEFPDLAGGTLLAQLSSPIERFTKEFPDVLLINGDEKKADLLARYKKFNDDAVGPIVALVQSDKNKGWSGHDTTGKHQRVLFNLGLPTAPTKAIQTEGRIYRTGQVSDAIMRYLNTGTNWERWAFATTIATRASTAENLASGELARALKDAFISAFEQSGEFRAGHEGEGKGGKELDRLLNQIATDFDRAKAFYWGKQKRNQRTKAQEGADYFATPEPIGLKMVEFGDIRPGEDVLEPSAGDGAIARWFPETGVNRTAVEQSDALSSRLALVFDGKIVRGRFEDFHVVNKADVIEMNPPFGSAGRLAIDHLAKAATHLRDYGRVVAIIPEGSAQQKFDKWFYEEDTRPVRPVGKVTIGDAERPVYRGDVVESRASWARRGTVIRAGERGGFLVRVEGVNGDTLVTSESITKVEDRGARTEKFRPAENLHLVAEIKLPGIAFERAGTQVRTRIVIIDKLPAGVAPALPQRSIDFSDITDINELFDRFENLELGRPRQKPQPKPVEAPAAAVASAVKREEKEQAQAAGAEAAADQGLQIVEYTTKKGKKLRGIVRKDITGDQAKAIDPYTFRHQGGWYIRLEHIKPASPGGVAQEEQAVYAVAEPPGTGDVPLDLFPDTLERLEREQGLPAPGARAAGAAAAGRGRNLQPEPAVPNVIAIREQPGLPGVFHYSSQLVEVGQRELPVSRVTNWMEAASALAALRRYAVEHLDVLVTDKAGTPLAVVGSFKGTRAAASVYRETILAETLRIAGAARAWAVHNHPSGSERLSRADEMLSATIAESFKPSGVKWMGIAAVGEDRYHALSPDGDPESGVLLDAGKARVTVPVVERTVLRRNHGMPMIGNVPDAKDAVKQMGGASGVLFLDAQHRVTAWVPMTASEMSLLAVGRYDKLVNAASSAGANAAIVAVEGDSIGELAAANMINALKLIEIRVIDAIDPKTLASSAERGTLRSPGGVPVMRRGDKNPGGMTVDAIHDVIDTVTSQWSNPPPMPVVLRDLNDPATPLELVAEFERQQAEGGDQADVHAAYLRGRLYFFAGHLKSDRDVVTALYHEALGHYGLRGHFGPELDKVLDQLVALNRPAVEAKAASYGFRMDDEKQRRRAAEEVLAELAETRPESTWVQRAIAAIRTWLREHVPGFKNLKLSDAEIIRDYILPARRFVERGEETTVLAKPTEPVFSLAEKPAIWYSELARRAAAAPMKAAPASAWAQWLRSQPGIKPDEIEWSGIVDWLDMQQGKVTREAVQQYLKAAGVQVQETVLADNGATDLPAGWRVIEQTDEDADFPWALVDENGEVRGEGDTQAEAMADGWDADSAADMPTKYSNYTIPGGTNYREVLLTLPSGWQDSTEVRELRERAIAADRRIMGLKYGTPEWKAAEAEGMEVRSRLFKLTGDPYGNPKKASGGKGRPDDYRSSHWDQPNVLAHIRLNDRTDADGRRVLFVEEIQSDWAQEGKKKGFATGKLAEAEAAYMAEVDRLAGKYGIRPDAANKASALRMAADRDDLVALIKLNDAIVAEKAALPRAPFVAATDKWVTLALKRIVKMAVDEGYDRVAMVTGEQSAERYDLSKHVNSLVYDPDREWLMALDKEDRKVINKQVPTSELPDVIGKEAAERLLATKPRQAGSGQLAYMAHIIEGADLKVGGEGMKAFYDRIVPSALKDLLRKVGGGQIGEVRIPKTDAKAEPNWSDVRASLREVAKGAMGHDEFRQEHPDLAGFVSDEELEALDNRDPYNRGRTAQMITGLVDALRQRVAAGKAMKQPGFDITPEMREKVAGGMPLFSRKQRDPATERALAKAGVGGPASVGQKLRNAWSAAATLLRERGELATQARQGMLDQFTGIQRAVERDVGNLPAEQDPYVAARLANGGTSSVMRALLLHGQARWAENGQHLEKVPGTRGLLDILAPLGDDINDWFGWMIGNRAARLKSEGRERNLTDDDIDALRALGGEPGSERRELFNAVAKEYAAFKRSVLDVAQGAGLINGASRAVWDHADYIPFYRRIDDKAVFSPTGRKGLAGQSSGIRVLKGGEAVLNDPMENLLMNFSRLIDASLKNNAIRKTVDVLTEAGSEAVEKVGWDMSAEIIPRQQVAKMLLDAGTQPEVLDALPEGVFDGMAKMWAIQAPTDPDVVRVMVDGKPKFYRVNDPLLLSALTSFVPFDFPGLALMRGAKRLLTSMVTATPEFMIANWIRDSAAAQAITRDGFNPAKSVQGIAKSFAETGGFEVMLFAGASFQGGQIHGADPEAAAVGVRRALRRKGMAAGAIDSHMATVLDTPAKVWDVYRRAGEAIENANREAVFEAAMRRIVIENGQRIDQTTRAVYEAKDLMDFSLRGSWAGYQVLADVVPFLNARVQGLYRLGRADPKRLVTVGLLITAASVLLAAANDGEDWYEELPDWDKDTYWHFRIGGKHFRIPKPFEIGLVFATIPERIGRSIKGLDTGKKTVSRLWAGARDTLAFDPVPQLVRPALNVLTNKDTFRDMPIESRADEGLPAHARARPSTSATMRRLSADILAPASAPLEKVGMAEDAFGLSPKRLEYLVQGYFGTIGMYVLGLSDMVVRQLEDAPPRPAARLDDLPVIRRFYREDPARATVYESDLYKMREEVGKIFKEVNALKDKDPQAAMALQNKEAAKLGVRGAIERAASELQRANKERDAIYADRALTPEQKRKKLDELQRLKNQAARETATNKVIKEAF